MIAETGTIKYGATKMTQLIARACYAIESPHLLGNLYGRDLEIYLELENNMTHKKIKKQKVITVQLYKKEGGGATTIKPTKKK